MARQLRPAAGYAACHPPMEREIPVAALCLQCLDRLLSVLAEWWQTIHSAPKVLHGIEIDGAG